MLDNAPSSSSDNPPQSQSATSSNNVDQKTLKDTPEELESLKRYAKAVGKKLLESEADIDASWQVVPAMVEWCLQHPGILVMSGGMILVSAKGMRDLQSCKAMLLSQGMTPRDVLPATTSLIYLLLQSVEKG